MTITEFTLLAIAKVKVGSEMLFTPEYAGLIKHKKIGLITNHTAVNNELETTLDCLKQHAKKHHYTLTALFAPEHGLEGLSPAGEKVKNSKDTSGIPIYSLHGTTLRPTDEMLKNVNLLIYDIQDIGSRSYTYINTLFFVMEEAAKRNIPVIVLDRPNPINGYTIDGPILEEKWRSILGYVNLPYCHGMTVGELAKYFNGEYKTGCQLHVVPMKGWKRSMSFADTGLTWIPTSPYIPEPSTVFYYPTTGILGELGMVNIGIGYTLPFKLVGAPWIQAAEFAKVLNDQRFPGVFFQPFHYRPFYGKFAKADCHGVLIVITDPTVYKPVTTQYLIMGILKHLYPAEFKKALENCRCKEVFSKINGTELVFQVMENTAHIVWPLLTLHQKERESFKVRRERYLIKDYGK
jgi:uncharacterized protein YbbC (DUF1343 family)